MIFLIGIPVYSLQLNLNIRKYINKQFNHHEFVAIPDLPKWLSISDWTKEIPQASVSVSVEGNIDLGLLFLLNFENYTFFMTATGYLYHVGKSDCGTDSGCIALVHYSRPSSSFDGGNLTFIDVFSYDGVDYRNFNYLQRYKLIKLLPKLFSLSKYTLNYAELTSIENSNKKTFVLLNSI
jgi:hypothetical protein